MPVIELPWAGVEKAVMQIIYERSVAGKPAQDVAVTKIAFRATSAAIADWNATVENADMAACEAAFVAFQTARQSSLDLSHKLVQFRWYELHTPTAPSGDPMRVNTLGSPVVGSASTALPPQVAINLTLETDNRRRWGRMCFPFLSRGLIADDGRVSVAGVDAIATNAKTFLDACVSAHMHPIIYSRPSGTHLDVKRLRVDDTYDIIRRRRYEGVPYRALRTLA